VDDKKATSYSPLNNVLSRKIGDTKYRHRKNGRVIDRTIEESWHRAYGNAFHCFVMGEIEDFIPSFFDNLKEGALTMQQGRGYDFSTLRHWSCYIFVDTQLSHRLQL